VPSFFTRWTEGADGCAKMRSVGIVAIIVNKNEWVKSSQKTTNPNYYTYPCSTQLLRISMQYTSVTDITYVKTCPNF